ncbi:hypothetical protein MKW98_008568 [Papaver atlanticum]|uniref:NAC domain-containing protein n=1 Tax=Papaver atlanticum TaxID=357466 RepID=A0AAD4TCW7_9MAGN|nr:hypothetical protein MKW98_008568 [Papaver atlanticum]
MCRANNYDYNNQERLADVYFRWRANYPQDVPGEQYPREIRLYHPYLRNCNHDVPDVQFDPPNPKLFSMYLKPKIENPEIKFELMPCIPDVNVYEYHPEKLLEKYQQKPAYFFTKRTMKYPNGKRPNRTVKGHGYWRMITKTEPVVAGNIEVGEKSGLVFYTGRRRDVEGHGHWRMDRKTEPVMACNTEVEEKSGRGDDKSNRSTKTNWLMEEYHIPGSDWTLCWIYLFKHTAKAY